MPEGASFLLQWWYSMTSASGEIGRGGLRELHHEHGAGGEVRSVEKARSLGGEGGKLLATGEFTYFCIDPDIMAQKAAQHR